VEVVASLSQGRTAAAQCGFFTYKSVPVIFEPPCICCWSTRALYRSLKSCCHYIVQNKTSSSLLIPELRLLIPSLIQVALLKTNPTLPTGFKPNFNLVIANKA